MKENAQNLLDEVIVNEIKNLSLMETGSQQKSTAIEDLTQLYKLKIEEAKIKQAENDRLEEKEFRKTQEKSQFLDRCINVGLQIGLAVGGWIAYDIWNRRGLRFEETGTITSQWTRNLLSKMVPKK